MLSQVKNKVYFSTTLNTLFRVTKYDIPGHSKLHIAESIYGVDRVYKFEELKENIGLVYIGEM